MDSAAATNVQTDQPDVRLFALLTLRSELLGALRHERRPKAASSVVVNMAAWRANPAAGDTPAPLYRMTAELAPQGPTMSHAESELLDELTSDDLDASMSSALSRDVKIALIRAVDELPPQERTVISLYYFEQLPLKEIKGALDVTESRVSKIHARAILALRTQLAVLLQKLSRDEPASAKPTTFSADDSFWDVVEHLSSISPSDESTAIRNGLSANVWNALELVGFSRREVASVVGTSEKTIHRKIIMSETLATAEGDRTMRLSRLMLHALQSFGNADKAFSWLRRPNRALHGQTPLDTMVTESGAVLVRRALGVIAYGGVA